MKIFVKEKSLSRDKLIHELKHHAPFTIFATIVAIIFVIFIIYFVNQEIPKSFFHGLHFLHIFVSSMVTTAIFYKYKSNIFQAILVGIMGAIIIGSLSDVIFPYFGGVILKLKMEFHLPIIEETFLILMISLVGSFVGIYYKITKMPHFAHVFLSVFASLFYLLVFSSFFSLIYFLGAIFIVFISVIIPCCTSDILFPFIFLREKIKKCRC